MKQFGLGRKIAVGVGAALMLAAGWSFVEARIENRRVDTVRDARPVDGAVDFSKPGETASGFRQVSGISHFQYLLLELPGRAGDNATALVGDLRFGAEIRPREGAPIILAPDNTAIAGEHRGAVELTRFHPPAPGDYTLIVRVQRGAPALAGIPQRLVMRYEFCGLEYFFSGLLTLAGIAAALVGLIIILLACLWRRRAAASA